MRKRNWRKPNMMNVPTEMEDPHARSDEFLTWLYQKTLDDPDFSFYGYDEAWEESFGKDAKKCFYSLKERQYLLYKKDDSNSYSFGSSSLPTAVGLNKKAIAYAEKLAAPPPKVQPAVEKLKPVDPDLKLELELEKDVAWFIFKTTGNMRSALNYLEDAKVYLDKGTIGNRRTAEKEIREREALDLEIISKREVGK